VIKNRTAVVVLLAFVVLIAGCCWPFSGGDPASTKACGCASASQK